jgi:stage V sporulation protein D (sporulation-specific penicillin-binding protein)
VLGFTGTDHIGLYGLEAVFNDVLAGEDGIKSVLTDSAGRIIESASSIKKEAVAGSNIVTTIDSVIQYYAESAAYEAYLKNKPKRVLIIVSNPNTGEILAMAAYPGYSLDDPWEIPLDYASSYSDTLAGMDAGSQQLEMWKNPFTSFLYEPGSTFKVITVSSALEENVVTLNSTFYCNGYLEVGGVKIKCHVYPNKHGLLDLTGAVVNSCNPSMMMIAMEMGPVVFYKYIYDYGFGEPTGINLDGEESGILTVNQDINIVDYVTMAFGQGIAVTPIQMMQALNAAINGGELLYPNIIKYILDAETNNITYTYEKQVVRQIVSAETSQIMRGILYTTAQNVSGIANYRSLPIGGKTGTAQKFINGRYTESLYVSSFYGMIPYDDPQLSVLVIVDEASGVSPSGSAVAAPVGAEVLSNAYSYLLAKNDVPTNSDIVSGVTIPDVRGKDAADAENIFRTFGIQYSIQATAQASSPLKAPFRSNIRAI